MPRIENTENPLGGINELSIQESETVTSVTNIEREDNTSRSQKDIIYFAEVKRKLIHLFSLNIPIWYIFLDKTVTLSIMIVITILTVLLDITSKRVPLISNLWDKIFGDILRRHETVENKFLLNGASWLTISACVTIIVFPKIVAIVALTILIISDISSALIGRKFGKTPFFKKSVEGSTAFFVSAILVVLIYAFIYNAGSIFIYAGIAASLVSAFCEGISKDVKIDDNILAPISFAIVFWLGEFIALSFGQSYIHIL
jgi:dolichol kinase